MYEPSPVVEDDGTADEKVQAVLMTEFDIDNSDQNQINHHILSRLVKLEELITSNNFGPSKEQLYSSFLPRYSNQIQSNTFGPSKEQSFFSSHHNVYSVFIVLGAAELELYPYLLNDALVCLRSVDSVLRFDDVDKYVKQMFMERLQFFQFMEGEDLRDFNYPIIVNRSTSNFTLRYTLLVSPTVSAFKTMMEKSFDAHYFFVYCGHGCSHGNLYLQDGTLNIVEVKHLCKNAKVQIGRIILNCCYALLMCSLISEDKSNHSTLDSIIELYETTFAPKPEKCGGVALLTKEEFNLLKDDIEFGYRSDLLKRFLKLVICPKDGNNHWFRHSFLKFDNFELIFLSIGVLDAHGHLQEYFPGLSVDQGLLPLLPIDSTRGRQPYHLSDYSENVASKWDDSQDDELSTESFEDVTVIPMQAECGDCTLLKFGEMNILIDGGNNFTPCFLDHVKSLYSIDLILLTHGDGDHVNGLQSFFQWKAKNISKHPYIYNVIVDSVATSQEDQTVRLTRTRAQANLVGELAKGILDKQKEQNIVTRKGWEETAVYSSNFDYIQLPCNGFYITVFCLLPLEEDLIKSSEMLKKADEDYKARDITIKKLTSINKWGIVTIMMMQDVKRPDYLKTCLFSGDADGSDIINALEKFQTSFVGASPIRKSNTLTGSKTIFKGRPQITKINASRELKTSFEEGPPSKEISSRFYFDYVHLPHHGSENNHPKKFLDRISCDYLVVSTNCNSETHGHPHPETLRAIGSNLNDIKNIVPTYPQEFVKKVSGLEQFPDDVKENLIQRIPDTMKQTAGNNKVVLAQRFGLNKQELILNAVVSPLQEQRSGRCQIFEQSLINKFESLNGKDG
eukprot:gene5594-6159_t